MENSSNSKYFKYNRLIKEYDGIYSEYIKYSGLSDAAFWILYFVCERDEPYTQSELCDIWFYSRQTINSALKTLIDKGYVTLVPLKGSRRSKQIVLTDDGREYTDRIIIPLVEAEKRAFNALGDENSDKFLEVMERLNALFRAEANSIRRTDK